MGKVLGLDLGTTTLGIAISDAREIFAYGYEQFRFSPNNYKKAVEHVLEVCEKEGVQEITLGLPLHMNGDLGERAQSCLRFKDELLAINPSLIIEMTDERMSTMLASSRLLEADLSRKKRKAVIDKMAAVVILETYLEKKKSRR